MNEKSVFDVDVRKFYDEEELEEWVYEITGDRGNQQVHEVEVTPLLTASNHICFVVVIKHCKIVELDYRI